MKPEDGPTSATNRIDTFRASTAPGEIHLFFGTGGTAPDNEAPKRILLSHRITLPPGEAVRLLTQLQHALGIDGESEAAVRDVPNGHAPIRDLSLSKRLPFVFAGPANHQLARRITEMVEETGAPFGFERSIKLTRGRIAPNRFLLGLSLADMAAPAEDRLVGMCRRLGMPEAFLSDLQSRLGQANDVLFGFEERDARVLVKIYLEYWDRIRERLNTDPLCRDPQSMYTGYKWDPNDSRRSAISRYTCHPLLSPADIRKRVLAIYGNRAEGTFSTIDRIIRLALERAPRRGYIYLEVEEEGNPRRSFDINFYKAGLRVRDVAPMLSELRRLYGISEETFGRVFHSLEGNVFGHLSGGTGRDGSEFATVYAED